jgi:hypothetical protein
MVTRGRTLAIVCARVLSFAILVTFIITVPVFAQQKDAKQLAKLDKAQLQDAQALKAAIDAVQAGGAAPSDIPATFEGQDFFKAAGGLTYVPFTMTADPKVLANPAVALMLRVVRKGELPPPPKDEKKPVTTIDQERPIADLADLRDLTEAERAKQAEGKNKKPLLPKPAYEDLDFTVLKPAEAGQPARFSRAFQAAGGEYDVYVGLKERNPADKKAKPKITVLTHAMTIPDLQAGDLKTSSVIVADKIEPMAAPLKPDQQRENPYTIGMLQIVPKIGTKFAKTDELAVYFQIYNAGLDAARKPDVLQEFMFYQKQPNGEKKIFNSEPSPLNATTLPAAFDPDKHQLPGGSAWPLTSFPAGDFRLEIKVTDKITGKTLTHNVNFSVG